MEGGRLPGAPVVRVSSRVHLAAFFPSSSRGSGRRGSAGSPPALMVDVRVVIRRHFPAGRANRIVEKVAEDIFLRRQPSRKLRRPERVERALAADVLPLVEHPFDRNAVVTAGKEISAYVSGACADPRIAKSGVQILVLLDTFAAPMVRVPRKLVVMQSGEARKNSAARTSTKPCLELEGVMPEKQLRSFGAIGDDARPAVDAKTGRSAAVGTIGDRRPKLQDERFKGWLPW